MHVTSLASNQIFVFGSNLAGRHGKGAALTARQRFGAQYGVGIGPTGQCYAIPTKDSQLRTLPVHDIAQHVRKFLAYARSHSELSFLVTPIGCGLAGHSLNDIAPMFNNAPSNVTLTWLR